MDNKDIEELKRQQKADLDALVERNRKEREEQKAKEKEAAREEKSKDEAKKAKEAFFAAASVYDKGICLHIGSQPRYFRLDEHWDEPSDGVKNHFSKLTFFSDSKLYPTYSELSSPASRIYLRQMLEGGTMNIPGAPPEDEESTVEFERRTFRRLANTKADTDPETYNMISDEHRMVPSGAIVKECPPVLHALMISLSGSVRTWEQNHWELSKQENFDWLEKWIYGTVYADVGNNLLGMPVIFGGGKVGKNALAERVIPGMIGSQYCFTNTWDIIDGNFNAFKIGKLFTFIDEVPPRDDWSKLKNMTGSPTSYVKEKYGPEFQIDNCIVYMLGSNEEVYPLPLEDGKQMVRVSPIKVTKENTFAECVVQVLTKTFVTEALTELGVDTFGLDDYALGDTFLKKFEASWLSQETLQEFLDYLHTKYGNGKFSLQPLRGKDWVEILRTKPDPITEVAAYVIERSPEVITVDELYEIYRIQTGTLRARNYIKLQNTVVSNIKTTLESAGYSLVDGVTVAIAGGGGTETKTKVFKKHGASLTGLKTDYSKYIMEELVNSKPVPRLIYDTKPVNNVVPMSSKFKI